MGGGNKFALRLSSSLGGLSPRGRGKQRLCIALRLAARSIPAWAGETDPPDAARKKRRVYPRVGGGNKPPPPTRARWRGLSPRGRGKLYRARLDTDDVGSIPAWAGETLEPAAHLEHCWVYPRVGGGNASEEVSEYQRAGLSPRGRGKRATPSAPNITDRSIPAWAGETRLAFLAHDEDAVYPRVGGGNAAGLRFSPCRCGLSPRGRGKRAGEPLVSAAVRSIPAWAGETAERQNALNAYTVYPRVGGGNRLPTQTSTIKRGLSPRGRGKLDVPRHRMQAIRSIPAWAGETTHAEQYKCSTKVYPRVGGGNARRALSSALAQGLSPRGRGKHRGLVYADEPGRSIPAWAGETRASLSRCSQRTVYPRVGGGNSSEVYA